MADKKKPETKSVEHTRPAKRVFKGDRTEADSVSPVKWAKDLFEMHGPKDALRIASTYATDTIGKEPNISPNPHKKFFTAAVNEITRLKKGFEAAHAH